MHVAAIAEPNVFNERGLAIEATERDEGAILALGDTELGLGVPDFGGNGGVEGFGGGRVKLELN